MERVIAHLATALRWSGEDEVRLIEIATSAAAMAVPALLASQGHHVGLGLIGGMAMSGSIAAGDSAARLRSAGVALLSLGAAATAACIVSRHGEITPLLILMLSALAAIAGGFSRDMVVASTRFIFFLVMIAGAVHGTAARSHVIVAVIMSGAVFAVVLHFALSAFLPAHAGGAPARPQPSPTARQKFNRLRQSLKQPLGWQYPARLVVCLGAVASLQAIFPLYDLHWASMTLVLLLQRVVDRLPVKTTQRIAGVFGGVCLTALLSWMTLPPWLAVMTVAILAGLRPLLRVRNYLAYSMIMTPLMILATETNGQLSTQNLVARLVATAIAAALVLLVNRMTLFLLPEAATVGQQSRKSPASGRPLPNG